MIAAVTALVPRSSRMPPHGEILASVIRSHMNKQLLAKAHQVLIGTRQLTVPQKRHTGIPVCQETRAGGSGHRPILPATSRR